MAISGSVIWPSSDEPLWRFNWLLANSPDEEGIVIYDAFYNDKRVSARMSLPILRVQYDRNRCGPYKDPLNYNNARTTSRCPAIRVCVYSYVSDNGSRALNVESYHRIGSYRLTHRWTFWENGIIYPRLYSAGLQCRFNHRHHAYWRLDFDIDNGFNNLALEYNSYSSDIGWGRGWEPLNSETSRLKNDPSFRFWAVLNNETYRGYYIMPGPYDGTADTFSTRDLWVLRYHEEEDRHGRQGNRSNDRLNDYLNGEDINGQDLLVWYCGHLYHVASGEDEWHHTGPNLFPFGNWW